MEISNLITDETLDINLKFYRFLKNLNSTNGLTANQRTELEKILSNHTNKGFEPVMNLIYDFSSDLPDKKLMTFEELLPLLENNDDLEALSLSCKLLNIKPLLLEEAKLISQSKKTSLGKYHPLSIEYDRITVTIPYTTRVSGALIAMILFDKIEQGDSIFLSKIAHDYTEDIISGSKKLLSMGVSLEEMFLLMFTESMNQSIKSDSGGNYEDRITEVLVSQGIERDSISKVHDDNDSSTEFDHIFTYKNKTIGISAKRTLRERYKQFIKTSLMSKLDIMIEITLGLDLTIEKAKAIRNHGVYLFVSEEVYKHRRDLQELDGVYSASDFNIEEIVKLKK
jgi:hypothetical protein